MQKKEKMKLDEEQLEEQVADLLAEINQTDADKTPSLTKSEKITAFAAILLFRSSKKLEMYSKALLVLTVILAISFVSIAVVLIYITFQYVLPLLSNFGT